MECLCSKVEGSYDQKPFIPPGGSLIDRTYVCECGRRWLQTNRYYHWWREIKDDAIWQDVLRESTKPVEGRKKKTYGIDRAYLARGI